jgi:hypothetical protein
VADVDGSDRSGGSAREGGPRRAHCAQERARAAGRLVVLRWDVRELESVPVAASPMPANGPKSAEDRQRRDADRTGSRVSHQSRERISDASMRMRQTRLHGQPPIGMMLRPGPPGAPGRRSIRIRRIRIGVGGQPRPPGVRAAPPLPLPLSYPLIGVGGGEPAERTEERAADGEGHCGNREGAVFR